MSGEEQNGSLSKPFKSYDVKTVLSSLSSQIFNKGLCEPFVPKINSAISYTFISYMSEFRSRRTLKDLLLGQKEKLAKICVIATTEIINKKANLEKRVCICIFLPYMFVNVNSIKIF